MLVNKLSLNIEKHYIIFAGNKNSNVDIGIKISGETLNFSSSVKYLGVLIDHSISWKDHNAYIHSKLPEHLE